MQIAAIKTTPLLLPYKKPYHWAQGVLENAEVILLEITSEDGITGYGEILSGQNTLALDAFARQAASLYIGKDARHIAGLGRLVYQAVFAGLGTVSAPRFGAQLLSGFEMALWDLVGRSLDQPVHALLGGQMRERISYFGFPQGDTPEEIAAHAKQLCDAGHEIIYVKIGRGRELDIEIARAVRAVIGDRRFRVDANEAWDVLTARHMIRRLAEFDIEFLEQPVNSQSLAALASLRAVSPIPLAADQIVFSSYDAFAICREQAADLIVLGLHETGGPIGFRKAAAIAEAAGVNVCLHGVYESGLTTIATNQVAATIPNLDDGNQYMTHFLAEDIVEAPDLTLKEGSLPVLPGPGFGAILNRDAVDKADAAYRRVYYND